ncbi:MAG: hypothetical protein A7316_06760 [Candidatus Altiarchaeales archaeon WOR_SM1_86-2]|nr:MAG: hypothetical protein A7316_06760 [Candidatus Altiarchaeales archaeon WOR_SM1_86-2]
MLKLKSRIGPKGQVVIPKPIRDSFGFEPGSEVYFHIEKENVVIEKKSGEEILEELLNRCPRKKLPDNIDWDELYGSQFGIKKK